MKKSRHATKLLSAAAIAAFIFLAIASGSDKKENSSSNNSTSNSTNNSSTSTSKQWTEVIRFKGNGNKKSQVFNLTGNSARLRYDFKAGDIGMFAAYVVPEGQDIMKEGGVPEVMLQSGEKGESNLSQLSEGKYYLNVSSANGKWELIVEELK